MVCWLGQAPTVVGSAQGQAQAQQAAEQAYYAAYYQSQAMQVTPHSALAHACICPPFKSINYFAWRR